MEVSINIVCGIDVKPAVKVELLATWTEWLICAEVKISAD